MAPSPQVEQILSLATELYRRGAVPEALAIAREVFVGLLDRRELADLLPAWIQSLKGGESRTASPSAMVMKAIDALGVALGPAAGVRAVTNLCTVWPYGAAAAEQALRALRAQGTQPARRWRRIPAALRFDAIGWESASPVLAAALRQRIAVPDDFTSQIANRLPPRDRQLLSSADVDLVKRYAGVLRGEGHEQPAIRLAMASAVTSNAPVPMERIVQITHPSAQVKQAAALFDARGYPTEAVNVLMDSLHGLSMDAEPWRELKTEVDRWLAEPPAGGEASRAEPIRQGDPVPGRSLESGFRARAVEKSFFFLLQGEHAFRDQVVRGKPADLHFRYDVLTLEALAKLENETLVQIAEAAREGEWLEIGVFVKPIGFTFRGIQRAYQIARIKDDALQEPVCFKLEARQEPPGDTGFHVVLTFHGAEVFQAFVQIRVVEALDRTPVTVTQLAISRTLFERNSTTPRDLTAFIAADDEDGQCRVTMRVGKELPTPPKPLNLNALDGELFNARETLAHVAELPAFRTMTPGAWTAGPGSEPEMLGALCRMMSAGSKLHKFLHDSAATEGLVDAIEALPDGARISIFTDSAFVPWEILFPHHFFSDAERVKPDEVPEGFAPPLLWGNRFQFETVLMFSNPSKGVQYVLPSERRQPGSLNIRIGVGSTVEPEPPPGTPAADAALNAVVRHRAYCQEHPSIAHWLDGSAAIREAFAGPDYDVSLLYLMCHGKSEGADEKLDFGAYQPVPEWLNPERAYPGWPIVFINSCSIAAVSPHVFDSFLRRFREKNAFGLIASSFPLPTRFATLFGCAFLERYQRGGKVGDVLLDLRRTLLRDNNPLGFFYALQCPLDVQRPMEPQS
ncbi:MAG: hypothetical protein AB7Q29_09270 [Vicinamibacterales bacterium]